MTDDAHRYVLRVFGTTLPGTDISRSVLAGCRAPTLYALLDTIRSTPPRLHAQTRTLQKIEANSK